MDDNITFAEMALLQSMENSRSVPMMDKINAFIDWTPIETILNRHYHTGKNKEGADAYHPCRHNREPGAPDKQKRQNKHRKGLPRIK